MSDNATHLKRIYWIEFSTITIIVVLISVAWAWFAFNPSPLSKPRMTIENLDIGKTDLCAGETLSYTYNVVIHEPGVYVFDSAVWITEGPRVVEWSASYRMVAQHAESISITRNWTLNPNGVFNTLSDRMEPWKPGSYERHIALTSSGRDTLPSIAMIPFTIREDCNP